MDTETMIKELRRIAKFHKNDTYYTFETNWYQLCTDVANKLEELQAEVKANNK